MSLFLQWQSWAHWRPVYFLLSLSLPHTACSCCSDIYILSSLSRTPSSSPNFSCFTRKLSQEGSPWSLVFWDQGVFKPGQSLANLDWEVKSKTDLTFESTFILHPSSSRKPSATHYSSGLKVPTPSWVVQPSLHSPLPPFPLSWLLSWDASPLLSTADVFVVPPLSHPRSSNHHLSAELSQKPPNFCLSFHPCFF